MDLEKDFGIFAEIDGVTLKVGIALPVSTDEGDHGFQIQFHPEVPSLPNDLPLLLAPTDAVEAWKQPDRH